MTLALRSRMLRLATHYSIPEAGAQVGLGRTASYEAAEAGDIPTEEFGRFELVPRRKWDFIVRDLYRKVREGKPLLPNPRKRATTRSVRRPTQVATSAAPEASASTTNKT